ncbi:MAG: hypothetical protein F6K65_32255 [Moorea sp. SIO3C2]|nr:hypothetical protein [Moorena sp. SIO3C2]
MGGTLKTALPPQDRAASLSTNKLSTNKLSTTTLSTTSKNIPRQLPLRLLA